MKAFSESFRCFALQALILLLTCGYSGAQPNADSAESSRKDAALRAARKLAEAAVAQSKDLRLDENHVVIESKAAEVFWMLDPQQARALLRNVLARLEDGDFREAAPDSAVGQRRLALRQRVLQASATYDPQFTLDSLGATKQPTSDISQYRRQVELDLAARVAYREPDRALKLAEKNLGENEVAYQYGQIISSAWQSNPQGAANLAQAVVSALRRGTTQGQQNIYSAFSLFSTLRQIEESAQTRQRDSSAAARPSLTLSLQGLADYLASQGLNSQNQQLVFSQLFQDSEPFEKYAPAKFAALKERFAEWKQQNPEIVSQAEFASAMQSANLEEQLQVASKAPPQTRQNFFQQIAMNVLGKGDVERARQIIIQNVAEPQYREGMLNDIVRQAAWQALSKGDFESARSYARETRGTRVERATFLAEMVSSSRERVDKSLALAVLEEGAGLLSSPPETVEELQASLQLAAAFAPFDGRRARQMLETAGDRINDVINSLAPIDSFLPFSRSFDSGELVLESGYASNSLIAPYASATAALANQDSDAAKGLADKLQRPEARAQVYLEISSRLAMSAGASNFGRGGGVGVSRGGDWVRIN